MIQFIFLENKLSGNANPSGGSSIYIYIINLTSENVQMLGVMHYNYAEKPQKVTSISSNLHHQNIKKTYTTSENA